MDSAAPPHRRPLRHQPPHRRPLRAHATGLVAPSPCRHRRPPSALNLHLLHR
ncbi:hypothetical protein ACP70R_028188 [Stipagrostis hirtigluma subsp. patula]